MRVDLHMHSLFSDGRDGPEDLAKKAATAGLHIVALTDHDSMEGSARFALACCDLGLQAVSGVEIDCDSKQVEFKGEVLAYFPHGRYEGTSSLLKGRLCRREERMKAYVTQAQRLYRKPDLSFDELRARKASGLENLAGLSLSFSKIDLFEYLQVKGVVAQGQGYRQFKSQFFGQGADSGVDEQKPLLEDLLRSVRQDGGYPVLAHPFLTMESLWPVSTPNRAWLHDFLRWAVDLGLWGVELYRYPEFRDEKNAAIRNLCGELHLGCTYGSDYHGKRDDVLGEFWGDFAGFGSCL